MQPAPDTEAQEMPGNPQAGNGTAGLPPPGPAPAPNQSQNPPQSQYPHQRLIRSSSLTRSSALSAQVAPIRRRGLRTRIRSMGNIHRSMGNIRRNTRPRRQRRPMSPPRGL